MIARGMTWSADPTLVTREMSSDGCGCGRVGHRVLQVAFERPEPVCDTDAPRAAPTVRGLRQRGLVVATVGAEGGWPRPSMWTAALTAAGHRHIAEVLDLADRHADVDGCGGTWTADQRCAGCGATRPLTDALARERLLAMPPGPDRDQEVWASQFSCPIHGRGRASMVGTAKVCRLCGQLLLRLLRPVAAEDELAAADSPQPERITAGSGDSLLTKPQRRALEILAAADRQGMLAGEVAQGLWPDSPGWRRASKGVAHGRGTAVRGKTMPMVAGVLLARLRRRDLVRRDDRFAYHLTPQGQQALTADRQAASPRRTRRTP
jgi:hypothetical protein